MTARAEPRYLTASELADRWQMSLRFVQQLASRGEITSTRLGRVIRFPLSAVEQYERVHTRRAGEPRSA